MHLPGDIFIELVDLDVGHFQIGVPVVIAADHFNPAAFNHLLLALDVPDDLAVKPAAGDYLHDAAQAFNFIHLVQDSGLDFIGQRFHVERTTQRVDHLGDLRFGLNNLLGAQGEQGSFFGGDGVSFVIGIHVQ